MNNPDIIVFVIHNTDVTDIIKNSRHRGLKAILDITHIKDYCGHDIDNGHHGTTGITCTDIVVKSIMDIPKIAVIKAVMKATDITVIKAIMDIVYIIILKGIMNITA
jgi:hypothetical protein